MNRTKERIASAVGFCLLWSMILFVLFAAVYNISGDEALLSAEMHRHAPPKVSGLPEDRYPYMAHMIATYLTDRRPGFQYYYTDADGNLIVCFQPHEAEHMADCRNLVRLAGTLRWILGPIALLLMAACVVLRKERKSLSLGMRIGFYSAAGVFAALLIWGLISFDSLFTVFHRLLFTNDGWLLDASTDMLIRLMPTSFFVSMGIKLLLAVLAVALLGFVAAKMLQMAGGSEEEQEMPENAEMPEVTETAEAAQNA